MGGGSLASTFALSVVATRGLFGECRSGGELGGRRSGGRFYGRVRRPAVISVVRGDRVTVEFTATYPDGDPFDTSYEEVAEEHGVADERPYTPLIVVAGREGGIPPLREGLLGMEVGEEKTIQVSHEELVVEYDPETFEEMVGEPPEEGTDVRATPGLIGRVVDVTDDAVAVDFDPDHSGQTLDFDVQVLDID